MCRSETDNACWRELVGDRNRGTESSSLSLSCYLLNSVETTDECGLADNVAFHCGHQLIARRRAGQIQLGVQSVELKHIVMERTNARARTEVRAHRTTTDARTNAGTIRQIAGRQTLRQSLCRSRNIEHAP